ncbi:hypothetical protein VTL71DRAFT_5015 [Oculimacula yallundae]|uniref:Uncharacterized protein n=1 Tax=Oculimacula yallundae TaxID=86028 RepID=A0ABR4C1F1_9HELO
MAAPTGRTTPYSREVGGESPPLNLNFSNLTPGFHCAANVTAVVTPSFESAYSPKIDFPHHPGYLESLHSTSALSSSGFTPQDFPTLSSSTFKDTILLRSSPPSESSISEFFRAKIPNQERRQNDLVRCTRGWVSQVECRDLPKIFIHNMCIAHYVQLRVQSKGLTVSSGKGRRTAAFEATAKELSLKLNDVQNGYSKGVNYLLLVRLDGPGSLMLIGKRVRTLWEKQILSEDIPYLVQFRRKHMPGPNIEVRRLNDAAAIEIISGYIVAKGWMDLPFMARLSSGLRESLRARKRRRSTQIDRPLKRSAYGPSEDGGLMQLLEAARYKECQNTFVDLFPQQEGPEITSLMETAGENGHKTWMQDLVPWSIKQPDITAYMTSFSEGDQSDSSVQDLIPWLVNEPDITTYMATSGGDGQTNTQMQGLFLQLLEGPNLTTFMKPFEQDSCLLPQVCAESPKTQTIEGATLRSLACINTAPEDLAELTVERMLHKRLEIQESTKRLFAA